MTTKAGAVRYRLLTTRSFVAVLFAMWHLETLHGEDYELQHIYFQKACKGGIVFG